MPAVGVAIAAAITKAAVIKFVATMALSIALGAYQQSRARKKAREAERAQRDAYNASLKDRHVTVRSGISTRKYVLGVVRVGGTLMHIESNGHQNTALDSVLALACNKCELVGYYVGDEYLAPSEFPGNKWGHRKHIDQRTERPVPGGGGTLTVDLSQEIVPGSVFAMPGSDYSPSVTQTRVEGSVIEIDYVGEHAGTIHITYKTYGAEKMRVIYKDGDPDQTVSGWADVATPMWTADHRLRGVAYLRTLNLWDEDLYHAGAPQMGAVLRGGWVDGHPIFDPRTSTYPSTSTNPAILAAWWMTLPRARGGMGIPESWIDWPYVSAAANVCDEQIRVKTLDGTGYEYIKRYECNTVLDTANPPADNLNIIMSSMAGDYVFTAGLYRIVAGAFRPATITLTDDDVDGEQDILMDRSGQDDAPANIVTSTFVNAHRNWLESSPRPIRNDAYIADDGAESPLDLSLPATSDERQASYIMGVMLESARPGFAGDITVLGVGEDLAVLDTVQLNLSNRPQYAGLTFQVVNRIDNWDGTFKLTLQQIRANIWQLDPDTFLPTDPTPVPDLSYLWNISPVTGLQVLPQKPQALADGTAVVRVDMTWNQHPQPFVLQGGRIETRYRAPGDEWIMNPPAPGDSTGTSFTAALVNGTRYQFQARAVSGTGASSNWTDGWNEYDGVIAAPPALTSLTAGGVVMGIDLAWTFPGTRNALRHTEIRYSLSDQFNDSALMGHFAWPTNSKTLLGLAHGVSLWFWGRLVDENGTPGPWYPPEAQAGVYGQSSTDTYAIQGYITEEVLRSAMGQQLWEGIESIPDIQAQLDELTGAEQHDPAKAYLSGAVVLDSGKMYRAKQDVPAETPITDEAFWQYIGDYDSVMGAVAAISLQVQEQSQKIEELDGVVTATASATSTLIAARRDDDDGSGALADVLNEWESRAWIHETRTAMASDKVAQAEINVQLGAKVDENTALVQEIRTVVATDKLAQATINQQLRVDLDNASGEIQDVSTAVIDVTGKFNLARSVRLEYDSNGRMYVAGAGIGLSNESGVVQSQFVVIADRFVVMTAPNGTPQAVFTIDNGQLIVNTAIIDKLHGAKIISDSLDANRITAASFIAKLLNVDVAYIKTGNIENLAVTNGKIGFLAVDTLKLAGNSVSVTAFTDYAGAASGPEYIDIPLYVTMPFAGDVQLVGWIGSAQFPPGTTIGAPPDALIVDGVSRVVSLSQAVNGNGGTVYPPNTLTWSGNLGAGSHTFLLRNFRRYADTGQRMSPASLTARVLYR